MTDPTSQDASQGDVPVDVTGFTVGQRVHNIYAPSLRGVVIGYAAVVTGRRVLVRHNDGTEHMCRPDAIALDDSPADVAAPTGPEHA